jgi:hypothetical protein
VKSHTLKHTSGIQADACAWAASCSDLICFGVSQVANKEHVASDMLPDLVLLVSLCDLFVQCRRHLLVLGAILVPLFPSLAFCSLLHPSL